MLLKLTSLTVNLLGSPVEIHLAGGEEGSARREAGGRDGGMLTVLRQSSGSPLRARAAVAAVGRGSSSLSARPRRW